jgi:hypothetical protein
MGPSEFGMTQFSSSDPFMENSQINTRRTFGGGIPEVIWQQSATPIGTLSRTINSPRWMQDQGTSQIIESSIVGGNTGSLDFGTLSQERMFPGSRIQTSSTTSNNFGNLFSNELSRNRNSLSRQRTGFQRPQSMGNNLSRPTSMGLFERRNAPSLRDNSRQRMMFNRQTMDDNSRSPNVPRSLNDIGNTSDVSALSASFNRFSQGQDGSRTSNFPPMDSILRDSRLRNPMENILGENRRRISMDSGFSENRRRNFNDNFFRDNRPRSSMDNMFRDNRARNLNQNLFSESRLGNSMGNMVSENRPRNSIDNILRENRPRNPNENIPTANLPMLPRNPMENMLSRNPLRNAMENFLSENRPRNSMEIFGSENRPRNSMENFGSENRPGNSMTDPLMNTAQNMGSMPGLPPVRNTDAAASNRFTDNVAPTDAPLVAL